jgi:hypothetical protein
VNVFPQVEQPSPILNHYSAVTAGVKNNMLIADFDPNSYVEPNAAITIEEQKQTPARTAQFTAADTNQMSF